MASASPSAQRAVVCPLGRMDYTAAWDLQRRVQARLIADKRARREAEQNGSLDEAPPHVLLLVEHPPVFTLGKSGDRAHLLADDTTLAARDATFVPVDRGGDITFHGPGQLVVYPILDLDRLHYPDGGRGTDIHRYLRELEEAVTQTCADYGLDAGRVDGRTGVWIGPDTRGDERKVCAMGIRCSRWVTMHGLALNVTTDLSFFDLIVPCGIDDRGVTSLAAELDGVPDAVPPMAQVTDHLLVHLAERFALTLDRLDPEDAHNFAHTFGVPTSAPAS